MHIYIYTGTYRLQQSAMIIITAYTATTDRVDYNIVFIHRRLKTVVKIVVQMTKLSFPVPLKHLIYLHIFRKHSSPTIKQNALTIIYL